MAIHKIHVVGDLNLAYAAAGADDIGNRVGEELESAIRRGKIALSTAPMIASDIARLANKVWRRESIALKQAYPIDPSHTARGVVVCFAQFPSFCVIFVGRHSRVEWHLNKTILGDVANPAKYFYERYYSRHRSLPELQFLAVHTILIGSKLAPLGVGDGVDVVVSERGAIRTLSDSETSELEKRSAAVDALIEQEFHWDTT